MQPAALILIIRSKEGAELSGEIRDNKNNLLAYSMSFSKREKGKENRREGTIH